MKSTRLLLFIALSSSAAGCERAGAAEGAAASASAVASAARRAEASARFAKMTPADRLEAAKHACYVGPACEPGVTDALYEAGTDAERAAYRVVARPAFAEQYRALLESRGKRPDSVQAAERQGTLLRVTGELCSGFFVKDFVASDAAARARFLGFDHFECRSRALTAKAEL